MKRKTSKEKTDKEDAGKTDAGWTELKELIRKKKAQNEALKKIIDKINNKDLNNRQ